MTEHLYCKNWFWLLSLQLYSVLGFPLYEDTDLRSRGIGAKPNLYCKAIELVCGGSPNLVGLVERKFL